VNDPNYYLTDPLKPEADFAKEEVKEVAEVVESNKPAEADFSPVEDVDEDDSKTKKKVDIKDILNDAKKISVDLDDQN